MRSRVDELARRRRLLVARSKMHRADLGRHVANLRGGIALAEGTLQLARGLVRNGPALGVIAAVVIVAGPRRIFRAVALAARFAPFALQAFALARGSRSGTPPLT